MKLNIRPREFAIMDIREKAIIIAFIDQYIKDKKDKKRDKGAWTNRS